MRTSAVTDRRGEGPSPSGVAAFGGARTLLATSALFSTTGLAGAADALFPFSMASTTSEIVNFSVVLGAISAALLSATWMIRERARIEADNVDLRASLADANAKLERYQALVTDKDRCILVWDGAGQSGEMLGGLAGDGGVPQSRSEFIAFGRWLSAASAAELDNAVDKLRSHGERFDLLAETLSGGLIEVQGRVSGGRAFARFCQLGDIRARLANLSLERDRLAASLETLQRLLDAVDTPAWLRGTDGHLVWVNTSYANAVEATGADEATTRGLELIGAYQREKIASTMSMDRPFEDRVSTVVRGNRTIYEVVEAQGTAGTAGIARDISDLEDARAELQRTIRSHADTLDHLATAVAIFDQDQRLQFYNQAFANLWSLDIPFLESRPGNGDFFERLRSDGKLSEQHSWREWKDDQMAVYRSVEPQRNLWYLPDGQTLNVFATPHPQGGATWVFENLTEQVDLEARYNTLLKVQGETIDHLAEGVCVFGADGKLKLSNPAFRALWGVSEAQAAVGTHIREIAKLCRSSYEESDGWPRFAGIITSLDEERLTHEGRISLKTGLVLDYALVPLPNAQTMLTFVNVTDAASVEQALTEKNDALRKADALKNDFVKHVSYELRTPLTNIIGFADLLKTPGTGALNDRQSDYVDHIATSSSVLLTIVNDILDLATVDAGIMKLDLCEVDAEDVLHDAVRLVGDRLKEGDLAIEVSPDGDLGTIVADPQRLRQILSKLLSNAANHAPEGSTITLSCRREETHVVFSVTDRGAGIPQHMLKSIFSRFETSGTSGRRRGAGLGLSIVESFVSLHEGTVEVESAEGQGTTIICRLPATRKLKTEAAE